MFSKIYMHIIYVYKSFSIILDKDLRENIKKNKEMRKLENINK